MLLGVGLDLGCIFEFDVDSLRVHLILILITTVFSRIDGFKVIM
jgi:hypothetical protein